MLEYYVDGLCDERSENCRVAFTTPSSKTIGEITGKTGENLFEAFSDVL